MRLALIGLGKMGYNMTLRLVEGGHEVVAVDRNAEALKAEAKKSPGVASETVGPDSLRPLLAMASVASVIGQPKPARRAFNGPRP